MITVGVDVGSLFSKAVVMDGDDIIANQIIATTGNIVTIIQILLDLIRFWMSLIPNPRLTYRSPCPTHQSILDIMNWKNQPLAPLTYY